jgi:tetratricopeptide (TPR) repeat protein
MRNKRFIFIAVILIALSAISVINIHAQIQAASVPNQQGVPTIQLPKEPIFPGQAPPEVTDLVLGARDLVIQRRYDEAEKALWIYTRAHPDNPVGPAALMTVLQIRMLENEEPFLDGEMRQVIGISRAALDTFRNRARRDNWYYSLLGASFGIEAVYYLWRDDYLSAGVVGWPAIQYLDKARKMDDRNWEARLGIGLYTYYRNAYASKFLFVPMSANKREYGINEIKLAGQNRKYLDETARIALCRLYMDDRQSGKAKQVADDLINQYPSFLLFYLFAARSCFEAGNYRDAIHYYEKAYRLDSRLSFAPYRLGVCYSNLKNNREATKWYKISVEAGRNRPSNKWSVLANKNLNNMNKGQ